MRLKPGIRALWRSNTEVQIGTDQAIAHRIPLSHPGEFAVFEALEQTHHSPAQLRRILQNHGASPSRLEILVAPLRTSGMLQPSTTADKCRIPDTMVAALSADAESRSLLVTGDGWGLVRARTKATVAIVGLDKTGANIAVALANAGVGRLVLRDDRAVTTRDLGPVYTESDIGTNRETALLKHAPIGNTRYRRWGVWRNRSILTAAIICDGEVSDPEAARQLDRRNIPHYPVHMGELSAACGPWVQSGRGACTMCISLARVDADPAWPALASQRYGKRVLDLRGHDHSLSLVAAGYACAQVLSAIEGRPPEPGVSMEFRLPFMEPHARMWQVHPRCPCHEPGKPSIAPQAVKEPRQFPVGR